MGYQGHAGPFSLGGNAEITTAYMHARQNSVTGPSMFGGTETIRMYENSLGIAYGMQF